MTAPKRQPGEVAFVRTTQGAIIGPLTVDRVEILLTTGGRFDRYRFHFCSALGHASMFPFEADKVFATREEASAP